MTSWVKLGWTREEMALKVGGESLAIPNDIYPDDILPFWIRLTVPANTRIQNKLNLMVGVHGIEILTGE